MDFFNCLSLAEAQRLIENTSTTLRPCVEVISLEHSLGRIIATDMVSGEDIPPFARSTVDGYAVNSSDTFGASEAVPATLEVHGEILMGCEALEKVIPGGAITIPTGAMLPMGTDAVVMLEHTEKADKQTLLVLKAAAPGENIIRRGEDIQVGQTIIYQGTRLGPAEIGALAACGCGTVAVFRQIKIGIISSGDEIVDVTSSLAMGQIRDVNSYMLSAAITEQGHIAKRYGIVPDIYDRLVDCLQQAVAECQLVLISGGSSVGERDHTVRALEALSGKQVLIHGIAVKPGKPTLFGMVGHTPVFGLPGHPVSAMTVYEKVVKPYAAILAGLVSKVERITLPARMSRNVASAPGRDDIIRVRLKLIGDEYVAEPVFGKSGLISTLVKADGLVHIASEISGLYSGDKVNVQLLRPLP